MPKKLSEERYLKDPLANSVDGFIEGLQILAKYMAKGDKTFYFCGAEHDILYFYVEKPEQESEEGIRLSELGFHFSTEAGTWAYFT